MGLGQHPAQQSGEQPHRHQADHQRQQCPQQRPQGDIPQVQGRQVQLLIQWVFHRRHLLFVAPVILPGGGFCQFVKKRLTLLEKKWYNMVKNEREDERHVCSGRNGGLWRRGRLPGGGRWDAVFAGNGQDPAVLYPCAAVPIRPGDDPGGHPGADAPPADGAGGAGAHRAAGPAAGGAGRKPQHPGHQGPVSPGGGLL